MAVLALISFFFIASILYIIYSVKEARVYYEVFDEEEFSKPEGWKVGKLPDNLKIRKTTAVVKKNPIKSVSVLDKLMENWKVKELSKDNKTDY